MRKIPDSVLALLRVHWRQGGSVFESVPRGPDNRTSRGTYFIRKGFKPNQVVPLTWDETRKLIADRVLAETIRSKGVIGFDKYHALALYDFCGEVYAAWDKFQSRLKQ